jgi:hypothetical protein
MNKIFAERELNNGARGLPRAIHLNKKHEEKGQKTAKATGKKLAWKGRRQRKTNR